ncbi:MAG TPA: bifunctional DNA primase/polymerase [Candidatus Gastranaerophilales bacterium]|nr:bifunctional DNA primase/polymerase [Candidatus Gastranaerophilales bacterium]
MLISLEQQIFNLQQLYTVPVYPNQKRPATKHGYKDGKLNADIRSWLNKGYNIGISLSLSGLGCLDIDMHGKSDGLAVFKSLCKKLGIIDTYAEQTATGNGLHYVVNDEGITVGNCEIAPGVEFKRNGIIVCSPSQINNVQYKIIGGVNSDGTYNFGKVSPDWLVVINNASKTKPKKTYKVTNKQEYKARNFGNLDYNKIFQSCKFLMHTKINSSIISEPEWFTAVNMLAVDINSDAVIHWLSEDYPKYSFDETKKKILASRNNGLFCGCNYVARTYYHICQGCPRAERIKGGK